MTSVERSQIVGIFLIFGVLLVYMLYIAPPKEAPPTVIETPTTPSPNVSTNNLQQQDSLANPSAAQVDSARTFEITTQDLQLLFSTQGGRLLSVNLANYRTYDQKPLTLWNAEDTQWESFVYYQGDRLSFNSLLFDIQTPTSINSTNHVALEDTLVLRFVAASPRRITQTYRIAGSGYGIDYQVEGLENAHESTLHIAWAQQLRAIEKDRNELAIKTKINIHTQGDLEDITGGSDPDTFNTSSLDWVAVQVKFFSMGLLFDQATAGEFSIQTDNNDADDIIKQSDLRLATSISDTGKAQYRFYLGPNDIPILRAEGRDFEDNVYLGWTLMGWINRSMSLPLFYWSINWLGHYGLAIIVLVVLIRILVLPLTYRSYIGMARMRVLKPEIDALKAEYPKDSKKQQRETMLLYQQAGINPLSGCVPLLLQMPILLAMFSFFPNMIDFRQQPFLWAADLSSYDSVLDLPFNIPFYGSHVSLFTLLMAGSTLLFTLVNRGQMANTPAHFKSIQYFMPIMLLFFLNSYSAALTFYYFVSNIIAVGQQLLIRRLVDENRIKARLEENRKKNKNKKKGGFQKRIETALRESNNKKGGK